ncbi:DUF3558 domain-containing protein [Streptomyces sp. SCSIO 30461]|uniref:DUF3558 domain-containing protein n=1 Tax=Streptomyces sp. SCSIO 30461 TaxID=3118085 RepID=UPI0030CAC401
MQRKAAKAYVPALAALLAVLAAGCTSGAGDSRSGDDTKPGSSKAPAAAPGKYRTLYEPCGAVPAATLLEMLPGAAELPADQQSKAVQGTPAITYDTDRRVGCSWKADGTEASHRLRIDVERVVSYDPAVSDDDQAQGVYARKQEAAQLPAPVVGPREETAQRSGTPGGSTSPAGGTTPGTPAPEESPSGAPRAASSPSTSGSPDATATPDGLEPRELDGLGDAAFIDDVLTRSGSTAQRRTVSVVFRTSNVIVTVEYAEQPGRITEVPDSGELQEKAQALARNLAERFND